MWVLLVLLIAGTIMMEWPMNPRKKKEKKNCGNCRKGMDR